jgi:two-component system sensor histidine kinase YesM
MTGLREYRSPKPQASLRTKLILGFLAITVPLFALLTYNNLYAMGVVRTQVAGSNQNLLRMYMNDIDNTLEDSQNYLYSFVVHNTDLAEYSRAAPGSADYYFAKVRLQNKWMTDLVSYPDVGLFFMYTPAELELLSTSYQTGDQRKLDAVTTAVTGFIQEQTPVSLAEQSWRVVKRNGEAGLVRLVRTDSGLVMGAWIELEKLILPLRKLELGEEGQAMFVSGTGEPLTEVTVDRLNFPGFSVPQPGREQLYQKLSAPANFLVVRIQSVFAELSLAVIIPESRLLQQLPYFQRLIFWIPLLALAVLVVYLLILQRTLIWPMNQLIKGMRRLRRGELNISLEAVNSREFTQINETFNTMVEQIEHLKINVYEEQIRTQRAEFKHLQAQINPHFLLNTINIIYQLAELKKTELIQQMAKYMSKYFRFLTRTNLQIVSVAKELEHIESYLEIQKLRYPQYLDYTIAMEPEHGETGIPPLAIQSLVENAIKHGIEFGEELFRIEVTVMQGVADNGQPMVEIRVSDNGRGIDPDKLSNLDKADLSFDSDEGHLGIWNLRHRLQLLYGDTARLSIRRLTPKGTRATIQLPIHN